MKGLNFIYCMKLVKNIRCLILINLKVFLEKTYLIKPRKTHRKQYILKSGDGWTCRPVTCNVSRNKDLNVFNECFSEYWNNHFTLTFTAQKMKFSNKDFFSKCDQIRRNLRIWSHLLKKSLMENFIFCVVPNYKLTPRIKAFISPQIF